MRGLLYLLLYPFLFVGCLLTTWIFQLFWIFFQFNKIVTDNLGIDLPPNLENPTYWESFWILMLFGFLRLMFFPLSVPDHSNSEK